MKKRSAILSALGVLVLALVLTSISCSGDESPPETAKLDLAGIISQDGILQEGAVHVSADGRLRVEVSSGSTVLTAEGSPLQSIEVHEIADPPSPGSGALIMGVVYDLRPDGATFDPPAEATIRYDSTLIPAGVLQDSLMIAFYNIATGEWVALPSTVDTVGQTVVAAIGHLTQFALYYSGPAATPAASPLPSSTPVATVPPTPAPISTLSRTSTPSSTPSPTLALTPVPVYGGFSAPPPIPPITPSPAPTPTPYLPEVPRISAEELKAMLDTGLNVVIIDSRSAYDYEQSRIAGAISMPLGEMSGPYSDLDPYDEIVTYCT